MASKARTRHKPRRRTAVAGGHFRARRRTRGPAGPDPATRAAKRAAAWKLALPAVLFVVCFGAYVSNGDFLPGNDQVGNMLFSVNLLKRHSLSVSPPDAPDSFFWTLQQSDGERQRGTIDRWSSAADEAYRQGRLQAPSHYYYLSATTRPDVYVNTFGLGAALAGLPVYALLDLFVDIAADRYWWWHGGALTASLLTACAALFVFLAARGFVKPLPAFLVALAFGLGSCVWPISSQALWQHPANTFFLSLGAWFLLRRPERMSHAAWCGAAFGMAVLCRPASAVVVVCTGVYLLWVSRRRSPPTCSAGCPSWRSSPRTTATISAARSYSGRASRRRSSRCRARGPKTSGRVRGWRASGTAHQPVAGSAMVLAGAGVRARQRGGKVWREPRYRPLMPLQAARGAADPGGGQVVRLVGRLDVGLPPHRGFAPFLALLMIPVIEQVIANRGVRVLFGALLVWSVAVQFVGSYSYSLVGWTNRMACVRESLTTPACGNGDGPRSVTTSPTSRAERAQKKGADGNVRQQPQADSQRALDG